MRLLIERVLNAHLSSGDYAVAIDQGLLIYVGFTHKDTAESVLKMAKKIPSLRVFSDENGKLNLNILDIKGSVLSVPAFTLQGTLKKGHRPSFENALSFNKAHLYFHLFSEALEELVPLKKGLFGEDMVINASNDGPITLVLED